MAEKSILVRNLVTDLGEELISSTPVPLPNVTEQVLRKVLEWCEYHRNDIAGPEEDAEMRKKTTDIEEWDQKFMQVDQEMLFEIIQVRRCRIPESRREPMADGSSYRPPITLTSRRCLT